MVDYFELNTEIIDHCVKNTAYFVAMVSFE